MPSQHFIAYLVFMGFFLAGFSFGYVVRDRERSSAPVTRRLAWAVIIAVSCAATLSVGRF